MRQALVEKLAKGSVRIRQLGHLFDITRTDEQNATVRRSIRKLQDGTMGTSQSSDNGDEDEMGHDINLGEQQTVTHVHNSEGTGLPKLIALVLLGTALGAGGLYIASTLIDPPVIPERAVDTDTRNQLRFID